MNKQIKSISKNFLYALSSNLITLFVSGLTVLVIPKYIGIEEYGYFQLYIFYSTYTALLHFGWVDGIYLRFGGAKYEELEKEKFYSQFWMLTLMQLTILLLVIFVSSAIKYDENNTFIIVMMILSATLVIPKGFLQYTLQGTNRIKEYSQLIVIEKATFAIIAILLILKGHEKYQTLIVVDIICKLFALFLSMYQCKDLVFRPFKDFKFDLHETWSNISVGINLLVAYITGSLIIGIVRFSIERFWDIGVFGKISLTLNISNLFMIFINSLSVTIFPVLRRIDPQKLIEVYVILRKLLLNILIGLLLAYFPIRWILTLWLPQYSDSLKYMALLFPIMVFEGKMNLLVNTYLKALRKEKEILYINIFLVLISSIVTIINLIFIKNINMIVLSITALLCFRSIIAEILLAKHINIKIFNNIFIELFFVSAFIIMTIMLKSTFAMIIYMIIYSINMLINKEDIKQSINYLKNY